MPQWSLFAGGQHVDGAGASRALLVCSSLLVRLCATFQALILDAATRHGVPCVINRGSGAIAMSVVRLHLKCNNV